MQEELQHNLKSCSVCNIEKPLKEFYNRQTAKGTPYSSSSCKECCRTRVKNYRKLDHYKSIRLSWNLKANYGISVEEYNKMLVEQDHKCAICKSSSPQRKISKVFNVDHCHVTGKVRGLLCSKCNFILGHGNDSIDILNEAINYLKRSLPDKD